jgi:hypothetical protein
MINLWSGFLIPPYLMGWGTSPPTGVIPRSRRCYRGVNLLGVERDANTRLKPAPPKSCLAPSADPFDVGFTSKKRVVSKRTVSETAYHYRSTRTGRSPPYGLCSPANLGSQQSEPAGDPICLHLSSNWSRRRNAKPATILTQSWLKPSLEGSRYIHKLTKSPEVHDSGRASFFEASAMGMHLFHRASASASHAAPLSY